ncbi:MAG: hypothetical protein SFU99_13820 [Saprospiraceae bacterium]|nr:hypothetical protein [Saprospiraceae bacterium]
MKNYISLTFLLLIIGCSQNKDSKNSESNYNPNGHGEQTIKYKHLLTYFHGSEDSSSIEEHSLYIKYDNKKEIKEGNYFYTDLLELGYCYISTAKTKFPIMVLNFYDSLEGFPSSKSIDDIDNIGEPFYEYNI